MALWEMLFLSSLCYVLYLGVRSYAQQSMPWRNFQKAMFHKRDERNLGRQDALRCALYSLGLDDEVLRYPHRYSGMNVLLMTAIDLVENNDQYHTFLRARNNPADSISFAQGREDVYLRIVGYVHDIQNGKI